MDVSVKESSESECDAASVNSSQDFVHLQENFNQQQVIYHSSDLTFGSMAHLPSFHFVYVS